MLVEVSSPEVELVETTVLINYKAVGVRNLKI
jgi:hypothetical protein